MTVEKPTTESQELSSESRAIGSPVAEEKPHLAGKGEAAVPEEQEVDVWWGSYAGRTMAPDFVVCGLLTAATLGLAWYFRTWHGGNVVRTVALALTALLWLVQVGSATYRVVAVNYRLTTQRLFYDYGFFWPIRHEVDLAKIAQVLVERGPLERLMGVGRIRVLLEGSAMPPIVFEGVRNPEHVAAEIRRKVERTSKRIVT
jgi:membrane protein YdbS with pleckstrin-like domain